MNLGHDRRMASRTGEDGALVGILHGPSRQAAPLDRVSGIYTFVTIANRSAKGVLVESCVELHPGALLSLILFDGAEGAWTTFQAKIIWCRPHALAGFHLAGLEYCNRPEKGGAAVELPLSGKASHEELQFLVNTELMDSVPKQALAVLLNMMQRVEAAPGERVMHQGDPGDAMYLIYDGELAVQVETDGGLYRVALLKSGDVVGETAVLTGDRRNAHVDAVTRATLFKLTKEDFEEVEKKHHGLRNFLTEIVSNRFEKSRYTAHRTVGKYVVHRRLGKGGWGQVYYGRHKNLGMPAAIKMLKHDMAMEQQFLYNFRKEAEIIAQLNHPSIVQVFDIEELYRTVFIIMEYLEGEPLDANLERLGRLPPRRVVHLLGQILDGLGYAHALGVTHRDIKPANIFIQASPPDSVKILDFGLACSHGTEEVNIAGTVHYAAPEQVDGEAVDGRSDIYSLGIMAYELLTGQRPYPEDNLLELLELRCKEEVPDPTLLVPDIPEVLRDFILTACRIDPEQRFQTCQQALEHLAPLFAQDDVVRASRRNMTALHIFFDREQHNQLTQLLEEFGLRAAELGVQIKTAEYRDI